jgi:hypothetical protein
MQELETVGGGWRFLEADDWTKAKVGLWPLEEEEEEEGEKKKKKKN